MFAVLSVGYQHWIDCKQFFYIYLRF